MKYTLFFISNTFIISASLKLAKKNTLRLNFHYLKIIHFLHPSLLYRNTKRYSQKCSKKSTCFNDVMWSIIMKIKLKMKTRSQRYNINRPGSRYEHKFTEYKMRLSIMMIICIKQHLSNIWSSVHEKVKQNWSWFLAASNWKRAFLFKS